MRTRTVAAEQAHYVPSVPHHPHGPFPPELYDREPIVYDYEPEPDGGGPVIPEGGTAQNNFKPWKWYQCRYCLETVREDELGAHRCEVDDAEPGQDQ
jgi:hypothetical protein